MEFNGKSFRVFKLGGRTHTDRLTERREFMKTPVNSFVSHCVGHNI